MPMFMVYCKDSVMSNASYKKQSVGVCHQSLIDPGPDMSYFQVSSSNNKSTCKQPFVPFSSNEDRANLMTFGSGGSPSTSRRRKRSQSTRRRRGPSAVRRRGRRTKTRVTKVRLVNGKVALRIKGFPGVQRVGASQLVRFVPLNKLRLAAKRALGVAGVKHHRRRRRRQNRRRQGPSQ